jgi:hypothetical protein
MPRFNLSKIRFSPCSSFSWLGLAGHLAPGGALYLGDIRNFSLLRSIPSDEERVSWTEMDLSQVVDDFS